MSELKFIVRGRVVPEHQVSAHLDKAKPRVSKSLKTVTQRDEAKQSLGFVVLGYSPEHWAERAITLDSCSDLKTLTIRVRGQVGRYFGPNWIPIAADAARLTNAVKTKG